MADHSPLPDSATTARESPTSSSRARSRSSSAHVSPHRATATAIASDNATAASAAVSNATTPNAYLTPDTTPRHAPDQLLKLSVPSSASMKSVSSTSSPSASHGSSTSASSSSGPVKAAEADVPPRRSGKNHLDHGGHRRDSDDSTEALDQSNSNSNSNNANDLPQLQKSTTREFWKFRMRPPDDDEPEDWWFASTAVPLLAATIGPMANVMSIAALVTSWRANYDISAPGIDDSAIPFADPDWCIHLNIASLIFGFVGNFFLLCNFTRFIRYIIALPVTILFWFIATGILMAITIGMNEYDPPVQPDQTYTQGFWHAVIATVLYLVCALLLLVNLIGYVLGHYTQHFELTEEQRNLILQTMMFFIWLAGGGGVFARVCGWQYVDALYFCDVTILTVGFGDFFPQNDISRGLVFPFAVGGIIILGLMVSSIHRFARELGADKVVRKHIERRRARTYERTTSVDVSEKTPVLPPPAADGARPTISAPFNARAKTIAFSPDVDHPPERQSPNQTTTTTASTPVSARRRGSSTWNSLKSPLKSPKSWKMPFSPRHSDKHKPPLPQKPQLRHITSKSSRLRVLLEEKERFDAMRAIQISTRHFKRYFALSMSIIAFGLVWCVGAVVFWQAEQETQNMTYFQALYFCYVSLLTIGYGDLAPKSNAGKPFFIAWSLVAVPTMTILISDMGDTVVQSYKHGTFRLADWTVLPQKSALQEFFKHHPKLKAWLDQRIQNRNAQRRLEDGFPTGPAPADDKPVPRPWTIQQLACQWTLTEHELASRLTKAIRKVADDLKGGAWHYYTYEEWVVYTRLIRFTNYHHDVEGHLDREEADDGIVDWDWIGENSPMMSGQSESEWILDRLCESLDRYMRRHVPKQEHAHRSHAKSPPHNHGGDHHEHHPDDGGPDLSPRRDWERRRTHLDRRSGDSFGTARGPGTDPHARMGMVGTGTSTGNDSHGGRRFTSPTAEEMFGTPDRDNRTTRLMSAGSPGQLRSMAALRLKQGS